jgi:hypothetical protein
MLAPVAAAGNNAVSYYHVQAAMNPHCYVTAHRHVRRRREEMRHAMPHSALAMCRPPEFWSLNVATSSRNSKVRVEILTIFTRRILPRGNLVLDPWKLVVQARTMSVFSSGWLAFSQYPVL